MDRVRYAALFSAGLLLASLAPVWAAPTHRGGRAVNASDVAAAPLPADSDVDVVPVDKPHPAHARKHRAKSELPFAGPGEAAPPAPKSAVSVVVDGKPIEFVGAGPRRVNGSVLVPLRGVFERLGASVVYHATTRTIEATRGTTYIVMRVGDDSAFVNNAQLPLAQPAIMSEGTTLVPLRFVAQALGASVSWTAATQVVTIKTGAGGAPDARVSVHRAVVVGRIETISASSISPKITLKTADDQTVVIPLVTDTLVLLQHNKQPAMQAPLTSLIPGDHARVTRMSDDGPATVVSVFYDEIAGAIKEVVKLPDGSRVILFEDGQSAQLESDAPVSFAGRAVEWQDVKPGALASVRIEPQRKVGYAMTVRNAPTPAAVVAERTIMINSFKLETAGPFKGGDTIRATLRGSEGCKADFSIPAITGNASMTETTPGVYEGSLSIAPGLNASGATVIGRLNAEGARAPVLIQAAQTIIIDSKPPVIGNATPGAANEVSSGRPRISATLDDGAGSGVDAATVKLVLDGKDITNDAIVTPQFVTFEPKIALVDGEHTVRVAAADMVGNATELSWKFVVKASSGLISGLDSNISDTSSHISSSRPLLLTLRAQPEGKATFSVGTIATGIAMKEMSPGVYSGSYIPDRAASAKDLAVTAHFVAERGAVATATLSQLVSIDSSAPLKPTIESPKAGDSVPGHVVISGTSAPNATILVEVRYKSPSLGDIYRTSGKASSAQVQADETGHWHTQDLRLSSGGVFATAAGTIYTATAVVIDATGQQSEADRVKFRQD